ncbi:hypothetical protein LIER_04781 [Lithospermum erythrorhizon]|uniref:SWIM-type domain-containing protein n=1 Tax=Lithospermum erythrorhizon TaxID=34254 RepID=A0AAV3NZ72_LITER
MVRGKLIVICQFGGDFVSKDDGTLMYDGGDANAVNINNETKYGDLSLKLAEVCNVELNTMQMKYFLPGNRKHLITLRSDKDLKRLMDFHVNSVTVDIFVSGKQGFDRGSLGIYSLRESGVKLAESVSHVPSPKSQTPTGVNGTKLMAGHRYAAPFTNQAYVSAPVNFPVAVETITLSAPSFDGMNDGKDATPCKAVQPDVPVDHPTGFKNGGTPADTVKKRRRTASWTIGANGPTVVAVADEAVGKKLQKKNDHQGQSADQVIDDMEPDLVNVPWADSFETPSGYAISYEDWPEAVIESWKLGIVGVGQEFRSVNEFRELLQKYAIAHRFIYKLEKNDTIRASGRCVSEGCSWMIDASYVSASDSFKIKKFNGSHTCKRDSLKTPGKNWLVSVIKDKLQDDPNKKPKVITKEILRDFGIKLSYTQVWRGIEDVRGKIQGSSEESYNQLPYMCEKIVEKNPGSVAKIITDNDNRFQSLFVSFYAAVQGFRRSCRPLIFLESTPLKSEYQEILFIANAVDADDGFFPIAFAVVGIENETNWRWFLDLLKSSLSASEALTFVSDREKGLRDTLLEVFDNAYYGYSIFHLLENFKRVLTGPFNGDRGLLPRYFLDAAHALRLTSFKNFTEKIKQISSQGYDWVIQCEPEYWTSLLFKGEHYNHITGNVAESYIKLMDDTIDQSIDCKLEAMINMISEMVSTRHKESNGWTSKLAPTKERKIQEEAFKACNLKVLCSSSVLFEVHDDCSHVVNIESRECTCLEWKQYSMPCRHAIAVFSYKAKSFYDCCSSFHTAESYRSTYSELINPLPSVRELEGQEDNDSSADRVLPPGNPKLTAKQKKELLKTEIWNKRTVTCTKCKEPGHNKASCRAGL